MAEQCLAQIQACALRITRLDAAGVPNPGADNMIVTGDLTELGVTAVYEDGDEFTVKNACGDLCVNFKGDDQFKRLDITLGLCKPSPSTQELLGGGTYLDVAGQVGYSMPRIGVVDNPNGVSIELWSKNVDADGSLDAEFPYEWYMLPRVKVRWGNRTFNNGPITIAFQGQAVENPNWYDGPENDWPDPANSVAALNHIQTDSLPAILCGYQDLAAS